MNRARLGLVGAVAVGGGLTLWSAFGLLRSRSAEQVDYIVERTIDDRTEVRRYPELVKVETTGSSGREAFFRLFDYIQGANESRSNVSMTAPVRTDDDDGESGVRMAFYLPAEYTPNTAPRPTHPGVSLAVEPPRSVATRRFSWWAFDWRTRRQGAKLLDTLDGSEVTPVGDPFSLGYDDPSVPPFLRTNEVAVEVVW